MADGLSQEEKETLQRVIDRAKEFDQANKEGRLQNRPTEGQLYKWTNPLKGWQPRWFYVNHEQGVLHYCMSEEKRKQPPRASLHLWGAVVSPSDEDSQSFTIQGSNNDTYRLKAANAKDRQSWVSRLRMEVEHANSLAAGPKELISSPDRSSTSAGGSLNSSYNGVGTGGGTLSQEPSPLKSSMSPSSSTTKSKLKKSQLSAPLNLSLTKLTSKKSKRPIHRGGVGGESISVFPGGDDMLGALTRLQNLQETLVDQLETSHADIGVSVNDKNVLLLKATSQAAIQSIQDSLAMLNVQMGVSTDSPIHTTGIHSPLSATSPARKLSSRSKRPMSMIDTSTRHHQQQDIENDLDTVFMRSTSTSYVGTNRTKVVPKVTSKEAP